MATTDELRDRADWMLDSDPLRVLEALNVVLGLCEQWAPNGFPSMVPVHALKEGIGMALGIQEGGSDGD